MRAHLVAICAGLVTALAAGALMTSSAGAATFVYVGNDKVIGGIGVSGLSEKEDERIAYAAIRTVYK